VPTPPVPIPPGQALAWSLPTTVVFGSAQPGASNGSATADLNSMALTMTSSSPLGNLVWGAQWGAFTLPNLHGGTIAAIYPVVVGAIDTEFTDPGAFYALAGNLNIFTLNNPLATSLDIPGSNPIHVADQWSTSTSMGNTSGAITGGSVGLRLAQSSFGSGNDSFGASFIGLAVYYTIAPPPVFKGTVSWFNFGTTGRF
jgi:hypothetical protein